MDSARKTVSPEYVIAGFQVCFIKAETEGVEWSGFSLCDKDTLEHFFNISP